ncbi:MAG: SRPBCC family protein [Verrucomicrobiota bacterium]|jgi:ligand-binding SRPBCC domain-containing protein
MRIRDFSAELWLPLPPEELFSFFANAANLDALTPPWLNFHISTPLPITLPEGALVDYRRRVRGVPLRWRTRINVWEPPRRFADEQLRGPYRQWLHEHTFDARNGGTLARDRVRYAVPLDFLVHDWLVRPDVEKIFEFRAQALLQRFSAPRD